MGHPLNCLCRSSQKGILEIALRVPLSVVEGITLEAIVKLVAILTHSKAHHKVEQVKKLRCCNQQ